MSTKTSNKNNRLTDRILNSIEKVGNKLPHPIILFFMLSVSILVISWIVSSFNIAVQHPATGETIEAVNLLSKNGVRRIFSDAVSNFTGFAALGVVIVAMLGVGIADETGLINAVLKKMVLGAPEKYITSAVVFAGIMSNLAADAGYVVLVPLGAVIFAAQGRHPLVGLAAAFSGVSGGFSANLLITAVDPLLAGMTQEGAQIMNSSYTVAPSANYYFLIVSTILVTVIGTWVTEKIVAPRFGEYEGEHTEENMATVTPKEDKGLKSAFIWLGIGIILLLIATIPSNAILRNDQGQLINAGTPFFQGIVPIIAILFFIPGLAFGKKTGYIKDGNDIAKCLSESMKDTSGLIALFFIISQFVAYFEWSNLGSILAIEGAGFLQSINFTGLPFILLFILVVGLINLFIGGAATKWAIMSPIFVPMLMQLGYTPEFTQLAYRIGDSVTNIVTPLMTYFAVVVGFAKKYDDDIGIGTLISTMVPYSIAFYIGWVLLLIAWYVLKLPIGPGDTILF